MKRAIALLAPAALVLALALAAAAQPSPPATWAPAEQKTEKKAEKAHPLIDLNTASRQQLMQQPGITHEIAGKILAARPFKRRTELLTRGIVTRAQYEKLMSHVTVVPARKPAPAK